MVALEDIAGSQLAAINGTVLDRKPLKKVWAAR
jgi:hypothetical protein